MNSTLIILNILMSGLAVGGIAAVLWTASCFIRSQPPGRGRADWRGSCRPARQFATVLERA